jgi:putative spermidine/putrescine transport system substrate-binding protein
MSYKYIISATVAAMLAASAQQAFARDLTVVSWGGAYQDAQKKVYFQPFQTASGIKLADESWDGGIGILRTKIESGKADWDVVQVESDELAIGCDEGLFEKLDYSKIGGKDAYIPASVNDCGIGAILYDFVLAYDNAKLKDAPKSWADFWDTKKYPGKRALRQGPKVNLEIALIADGVAPKDVYKVLATEEGVDRAFKKLDEIKPDLIFWKAGAEPPQLLASGEVVMTSAYNGRITAANAQNNLHLGMSWNGALYTLDSWVILKGSQNLDAAYKFLNFAGAAENQKLLPNYIAYGVPNKAAASMIDPKALDTLPSSEANMANAEHIDTAFWLENNDKLTERFNKWAAK